MVDGIQMNNLTCDLSNVNTQAKVSTKTGELSQKETATYRGLYLISYPNGRVRLSGSLTTYVNGNNTKNLSYAEICGGIDELCRELHINPDTAILNGLEIGINIKVPYCPDTFLDSLIVWRRTEPLRWTAKHENYVQFKKSQVTLKVYNKGKQYKLHDKLLRYELRIDKMEFANKLGVQTLTDLRDKNKLVRLSDAVLETFKDLIYCDPTIKTDELKRADLNILEKGNNPRYWTDKKLHRNTYAHTKIRFKELVDNYGKKNFKNIVFLLQNEVDRLLKTSCNMTDFLSEGENTNMVQYDPLYSVSFCICPVTNYPKIKSGKNGRFLTAKDVEYFYKYDTNIYADLVERFNTTSYKNINYSKADLNTRFQEISHRIRAVEYNSRNNDVNNPKYLARRQIDKVMSLPSLFDNLKLISKEKLELSQRTLK